MPSAPRVTKLSRPIAACAASVCFGSEVSSAIIPIVFVFANGQASRARLPAFLSIHTIIGRMLSRDMHRKLTAPIHVPSACLRAGYRAGSAPRLLPRHEVQNVLRCHRSFTRWTICHARTPRRTAQIPRPSYGMQPKRSSIRCVERWWPSTRRIRRNTQASHSSFVPRVAARSSSKSQRAIFLQRGR